MSPEQRAQIIALRKQFNAKLEILLQQRVDVQAVLQVLYIFFYFLGFRCALNVEPPSPELSDLQTLNK